MGKSFTKNPTVNHPVSNPGIGTPSAVLPRDQADDWDDPYIPDRSYPEGTVCTGCGAVYQKQHWSWNDRRRELMVAAGVANEVLCPGCRIAQSRDPQGIVTLRGDYWPKHREDIMNLVHNEEERGAHTNPIERIIRIREEGDELIIETTTEKLGQRIGRAVHKAHKGEVEYQWGHDNQLVRVYWERSNGG
jgi:hypothetical protein